MSEENFYIGQIFSEQYPFEAVVWCQNNNACISSFEEKDKDGKIITKYKIESVAITDDNLKASVRCIRTQYLYDIEWRVSRYKQQTELKIQTADSAETYTKVLQYIQYLRDYPQSGGEWYKSNPLTFDEWAKK